jgi:hypothetical protein
MSVVSSHADGGSTLPEVLGPGAQAALLQIFWLAWLPRVGIDAEDAAKIEDDIRQGLISSIGIAGLDRNGDRACHIEFADIGERGGQLLASDLAAPLMQFDRKVDIAKLRKAGYVRYRLSSGPQITLTQESYGAQRRGLTSHLTSIGSRSSASLAAAGALLVFLFSESIGASNTVALALVAFGLLVIFLFGLRLAHVAAAPAAWRTNWEDVS